MARVLRERCEAPGWLDGLGVRERVVDALRSLETAAMASTTPSGTGDRARRTADADGPSRLRAVVKRTWPGRIARELTLERRFAANLPQYLRLARLTVLHDCAGWLGDDGKGA